MLNFAVGPVQMHSEICEIGKDQVPYFRTDEFSEINFENEKIMLEILNADSSHNLITLTSSGTGAMESAITNLFDENSKVLIINGGSFGERFVELCDMYNVYNDEIKLSFGESLKRHHLKDYENMDYDALLINLHETSSGTLYNIDLIDDFCKRNNMLLIVDAISAFLCDPIDYKNHSIDIFITGSQKALALPPGIALVVVSKKVKEIINTKKERCYYFSYKKALQNGSRGQTPFTPAVGIILQLNYRLRMIKEQKVDNIINGAVKKAEYFRQHIKKMNFQILSESKSNALTALHPLDGRSALEYVNILKNDYNIWVCPNGGNLCDYVFRVGHMGDLHYSDYDVLLKALNEIQNSK